MFYGIDLGTTKSSIGFWRDGKPFIIPDKFGNFSIPSSVLVTPENEIYAGLKAKKHSDRYKSKNVTISSVKRLTGKKGETGWGWWKTYPQEISAFILSELKYQAEKYTGEKMTHAVIAIPSHFDENQRCATKEAARIAGICALRLLNEAVASLLSYAINRDTRSNPLYREEKILIIDIGGGTTDVSIAEIGRGVYEIKSIEGDSQLGGDDFDLIIYDYIIDNIHKKYGTGVEIDSVQEMILKEAAERAKIELSSMLITYINIPGFIKTGNTYHDLELSIDRKTFDKLCKNLFNRATNLLTKALSAAGVKSSELNQCLLIGGCSRIPYFKNILIKEFRIEPISGVNIETSVAEGAIIQAAILEGKLKEILLLDVIGSSYGIGLEGDVYEIIIPINTTVPVKKTKVFTTTRDNQTTVPIRLYQGESMIAYQNALLGIIELKGIPLAQKGAPKIEVTFEVDPNMIIYVSARDVASGKAEQIRVQSPYGLNDSQIRLMLRKLGVWQVEREILD